MVAQPRKVNNQHKQSQTENQKHTASLKSAGISTVGTQRKEETSRQTQEEQRQRAVHQKNMFAVSRRLSSRPAPGALSGRTERNSRSTSVSYPDRDNGGGSPDNKRLPTTHRPSLVIPPRRERTRLRVQRARTQMLTENNKAKENAGIDVEENADRKRRWTYSNTDAANVYYANSVPAVPAVSNGQVTLHRRVSGVQEGAKDDTKDVKTKGSVKPKEYVLNRRESAMYVNIKSIYAVGTDKSRQHRETRFLERLEEVQFEKWKHDHHEYTERKKKAQLSRARQAQQLTRVRSRFSEEQVRRFNNQYVTGKILEHEWQTREIYGLPDDLHADPQTVVKPRAKIKKPARAFDPTEKRLKNKKRFQKLFHAHRGPRWDPRATTPKMEGIDTIVLGDGMYT